MGTIGDRKLRWSVPAQAVPWRELYGLSGESFGGNGLYILDEPEAALSPMRLMRLMYLMQELVKKNSQFIISTHSPILMTFPGAEVLEITADGITSVDYRDTEHYIVTKRFMDAPDKILESLLGKGEE